MRKISKFLAFILILAMLVPAIVDANKINENDPGIETGETNIAEESIKEVDEGIIILNSKADKDIKRIKGDNRVETAINVSNEAYPKGAKTVLLAGYDGQADALTATFVAGEINAPLLLTYKNRLDQKVLDQLIKLGAENVIILGGESVVLKDVEDALTEKGFNTSRIYGKDRIETAVNIVVDHYNKPGANTRVKEVFVVESNSLPDALAIGPVSAKRGIPVLLIKKDGVPEEVKQFLKDKEVEKVTIIGGKNTVSEIGKNELGNIVTNVIRIEGRNREETSIKISEEYFKVSDAVVVANGFKYTDALVGGYFAARKNAPILLTSSERVNDATLKLIRNSNVIPYILGGTSIITDEMFTAIKNGENIVIPIPIPIPVPEPEKPVEKPVAPVEPVVPQEPVTPVEPQKPVEPEDAEEEPEVIPEENADPEIPVEKPVTPVEPQEPVEPEDTEEEPEAIPEENPEPEIPVIKPEPPVVKPEPPVVKPEPKPEISKKPIVCLDYGHGGSDPGAGYKGRREKTDTIKIGKLVAADLRRHGVIVDETRKGDEFVSLQDRARFSNKKNYNYFVSFHRNAIAPERAHGVETWTSNYPSWKSTKLANSIQKNLVEVGFKNRGVKERNFYVVRWTKAPAVLIELGFIDHTIDNIIFDTKQLQIVKATTSAILGELGIKYKGK